MRLVVVRTGGVAGVRLAHELDTAGLDPGTAARVEEVAAEVLRAAPREPAGPDADRFDWTLHVDGRRHRLHEPPGEAGAELIRLVRALGRPIDPPAYPGRTSDLPD